MQLQVETQIYKKDAIKSAITDAGNKAEKYITYIDADVGIQVHNEARAKLDFIQVNSTDISMWRNAKKMMSLDDSTLIFYDGTGTENSDKLAEFGSTIKIYNPTKGTAAVTINSAGATFEGDIVANSLTLGQNASIDYSKVNHTPDLTVYIAKDGTIGTEPSDSSASSSTGFKVSSAGLLKAANAVITGKIFATAGIIGGWNIGTDSSKSLYYGNQTPGATDSNLVLSTSSATNSNAIGGSATGLHWFMSAGKVFGVTTNGALYSTSGHIGGWTIDANNLKSSNGTVGLKGSGSADADVVFWAGNATSSSAPFRVTRAGALTATSATFGGTNGITITSSKVTLGSNCEISWNNVTDKTGVANKTDIPTTEQITQITKNTVTTTYVNALEVTAKKVNVSTLSAITANMGTLTSGTIKYGTVGSNDSFYLSNSDTSAKIGGQTSNISGLRLTVGSGFGVTSAGKLYANDAVISGEITATAFKIGTGNYLADIQSISGKATTGYVDTAKDSAISTAATDATSKANEAATKATNYITISGDGILVRRSTSDNTNGVAINSDGVRIYRNANYYTYISANGMNIYAGDANNAVASFGSTITLGQASKTQIYINSTGADAGIKFITQYKDTSNTVKNFYLGDIGFDSTSGWTNNPTGDKGYFPVGAWATFGLRTIGSFNGYYSFVSGFDNVASHNASVSFGVRNKVYAPCGFAMGMDNIIGDSSKTSKNSYTTYDIGNCSTTIGYGLNTGNATDQFVCGRYNKIDTNCYFIVGGGYSDSRFNSFTVTKNGRVQTTADAYASNQAQISVGIQYSEGFREEIWMGVGSGGDNKGLYDPVRNQWILFLKNTGSASQKISTSFGGFSTTSDLKRKNIIGPIDYATDFIMSLKPKQYYWKDDKYKKINLGFVAQEVDQIGNKLNLDLNIALAQYKDKSKGEYHGGAVDDSELEWFLDYNEIIAPLVQVVQDQQKEIEQLKKEIQDLKNK